MVEAKLSSTCPVCDNRIEVGDPISKTPEGWVHKHHQSPRRVYMAKESTDVLLNQLVEELGEVFPGCIGLQATIESTYNTVTAVELYLHYSKTHTGDEVSNQEFHDRKSYLYGVACKVMEKYAADRWSESYPDTVWWPNDIDWFFV